MYFVSYNYIVMRCIIAIEPHTPYLPYEPCKNIEATIMEEQTTTQNISHHVASPDPTNPGTDLSSRLDPTSPGPNASPGFDPMSQSLNHAPGFDPTSPGADFSSHIDPTSPGPNASPDFD